MTTISHKMPPSSDATVMKPRKLKLYGEAPVQGDAAEPAAAEAEPAEAPRYWRSLDHRARGHDQTAIWAESEFPFGLAPEGFFDDDDDEGKKAPVVSGQEASPGFIRREMLQMMGASMALAGMTACVRRPEETILPYVKQPEEIIPGVPSYFASAFPGPHGAVGVLVESHEGRPTKIEGNPDHPASLGSTDRFHQAEILELYDPERARTPLKGEGGNLVASTWADADKAMSQAVAACPQGEGLALLLDGSSGPTRTRLLHALKKKHPKAQVFDYEPLGSHQTQLGAEMVFGPGQRVLHDLGRADRVVAIDHDFMTEGAGSVALTRRFSEGRSWDRIQGSGSVGRMNRLYVIESNFSTTGANADHRLRVGRGSIFEAVKALAKTLFGKHGLKLPESWGGDVATSSLIAAVSAGAYKSTNEKLLGELAADLANSKGRSVLTVGEAQPPAVHALAHLINAALGAFDGPGADNKGAISVVTSPAPPVSAKLDAFFADLAKSGGEGGGEGGSEGAEAGGPPAGGHWAFARPAPHKTAMDSLGALVAALNGGKVKTLIIVGPNPAYAAPGSLKVADALKKAKTLIHVGLRPNETAQLATWHLPLAHWLEDWDDATAYDGTVSIVQPLILPLHGGRSTNTILASVAGEKGSSHEQVKKTWLEDLGAIGSDKEWRQTLHRGILADPARRVIPAAAAEGADAYSRYIAEHVAQARAGAVERVAAGLKKLAAPNTSASAVELVFKADFKVADGRYGNNAWLQELPDSMTKLCWDTALVVGPALAKDLGLNSGVSKNSYAADEVEVSLGGATVKLPAFVLPGLAPHTATVALGYGRTKAGYIGDGVGIDAWSLMPADGTWSGVGSVKRTGASVELCGTQEHFALDTWERGVDIHELDQVTSESPAGGIRRPAMTGTAAQYSKRADFAKDDQLDRVVPGLVGDKEQVTRSQVAKDNNGRPMRPIQPTYDVFDYEGQQWGMVIDLTSCTGCHACVIACQAENNIPIVGRDQVLMGRELHWIRIDRYYSGNVEEPRSIQQPINCLHCENAPCEPVCPVAATVHDSEGLNGMIYNRCVGTRYCANNCPVKVRRFNYFDFSKTAHFNLSDAENMRNETIEMQRNPDVTVRFRGVIEKCSYCTQRINEAKMKAKRAGRDSKNLPDGAINPACSQSCPAGAITFGNVNNPQSRVARMKGTDRNYELLSELNIRPRTTYMASISNQNEKVG